MRLRTDGVLIHSDQADNSFDDFFSLVILSKIHVPIITILQILKYPISIQFQLQINTCDYIKYI
jgi:hypothetical protein